MKSGQTVLLILVLIVVLLGGAACAGRAPAPQTGAAEPRTALDVLQLREPKAKWDAKSLLHGDLDQDGGEDYAVAGIRGDRFLVGIVQGPVSAKSRTWTLDFPWQGGGQEALCSKKARVALEELDEEAATGAGRPEGTPALLLHDDRCDAFHIYWDPQARDFTWWRL